ncbi:32 kDa beta-galactoside-binding lectin-like [Physella acuta]|uniref:32 kDa beta-galactoside-binding lectin-like n=1 Tax=Physella acuta TaxID=109671 RepID=UPI0027DB6722|nr:32 kDa beta-galactoside-binding lectin-like [Physella acuta]
MLKAPAIFYVKTVYTLNMLKQILAFVFLLASVTTVYCGDALQKTHPDNSTLQHQSKRAVSSSQYPVPYTAEIRHPMFDGKEIYIEGAMLQNPNRFTLDLCETNTCIQDIEMQAEYRFNTERFSMNYKRNLRWGTPSFYDGKHLEGRKAVQLSVVINNHQFKVLVNTRTLVLNVPARMSKIKYIRIRGDVQIDWILYSPEYVSLNGQRPQQRVIIYGYPTDLTRFYFNFIHANVTEEPSDCMTSAVQVHFDNRLRYSYDNNKILVAYRNRNQNWNTKYIPISSFPYEVNVTFRIQITLRLNQFQFRINDQMSFTYDRPTDGVARMCYADSVVVKNVLTT